MDHVVWENVGVGNVQWANGSGRGEFAISLNTECAIFPHLEAAKCAPQEGVRSAAFSARATPLPLFE
jgi:hypothetical protein